MQTFFQTDNFLITSSQKQIKMLSDKQSAKVLVISDSHGHSWLLKSILEEFNGCDALLFCGDGIKDLLKNLEEAIIDEKFAKYIPPVIAFVQGNNDDNRYSLYNAVDNQVTTIHVPVKQFINIAGTNVMLVHGHLYSLFDNGQELVEDAKDSNSQVILFGHTHIGCAIDNGKALLLNPGSISRPRGCPASFAILEFTKGKKIPYYYLVEIKNSQLANTEYKAFTPRSSIF
ncbi:MAG: YfcE family phosphodiesterase [Treponema sp.]|nr:YfcE family phosphodiesterase [Treponema sp.]